MYHFTIKLGLTSGDLKQKWDYATAERVVAQRLKLLGFIGASFSYARGYWKGSIEDTLIVDIYDEESKGAIVEDLCKGLKIDFLQEAVLLNARPAIATLFI